MSTEIELKFAIDKKSINQLVVFLDSQHLLQQTTLKLTNTYYDTVDNDLRKHGVSIRIRGINEADKKQQYEITLKSTGKVVAGLHQRNEFNASLLSDRLDLNVLPSTAFPADLDATTLSQSLCALFTTDFQRQLWLVRFKQSQIEVALDQGMIRRNDSTVPIQELELELKAGTQSDLIEFAIELSQINLSLYSQSKAARGYRLLQGLSLNKIHQQDWDLALPSPAILSLLRYWQTNEEYALENDNLADYQTTLSTITPSLSAFFAHQQPHLSPRCHAIFHAWLKVSNYISDIKTFASSSLNTRLKLYLILYEVNQLS